MGDCLLRLQPVPEQAQENHPGTHLMWVPGKEGRVGTVHLVGPWDPDFWERVAHSNCRVSMQRLDLRVTDVDCTLGWTTPLLGDYGPAVSPSGPLGSHL